MIKDNFFKKELYEDRYELKVIFKFIQINDLNELSIGIGIINEQIHYIVSEYETHQYSSELWEKHNNYIDVQYIIKGSERILVGNQFSSIVNEYDHKRDLAFYNIQEPYDQLSLNEHDFVLIFPHEIHQPCVSIYNDLYVKKIVFKIKI